MVVNKMSYKGQIFIPKNIREKYGLKPECNIRITEIDGHIALIPIFDDPVKDTKGILKKMYPDKSYSVEEIIKEYRKEEKKLELREKDSF